MALNCMPKKEAQSDPYAFPGAGAEKMPYTSGLPWPKGLNTQTLDDKASSLTMTASTFAAPEFDHHRMKAPREPAVPLPKPSRMPWKGKNIRLPVWKRGKDTKSAKPNGTTAKRNPKLDPNTIARHVPLGEAYKVPVPEGSRRPVPMMSKKRVSKDSRENNPEKQVIALDGDAVQPNKPTSHMMAKAVSTIGSSAVKIDRLIHGAGESVISSFKASSEGGRRLALGAERKLHHPISSIHTRLAKSSKRVAPTRQEFHTFNDRTGFKMYLRIYRGLAPGEVEHPIRGHDWTRHFDCVLSMSQYSWLTGSRLTAALYFNNLPARLKAGVPWKRPSLTQRVREKIYYEETCDCCTARHWVSQTQWIDRSPQPQFAAVVTVGHLTRLEALKHNPFEIMANARTDK